MKRSITGSLVKWKDSRRRKPLLLTGVRQCGKTYIIKQFGKDYFSNTVYLNFEENERLGGIFEFDFDVKRIIGEIEHRVKDQIIPGRSLLILDEIQQCPRAITSLKYFCENMPELHIIAAGSLLGVALKRGSLSFPVGKVNRMQMYPMSFREFLSAVGADDYETMMGSWSVDRPIPALYSVPLEKYLKQYFAVGGMPEAVNEWISSGDISAVEEIQDEILSDYADDFAKHAPIREIEKIRWIWESVPKQLAKENNKFIFSHVKEGKRAAELEDALQWLVDSGLVTCLEKVEKIELPISDSADATYFKVYMSDIGLLRRRSGLSAQTIFESGELYKRYKGALTENYINNELIALSKRPYFWRSDNTAEIDFVIEHEGQIVPIEVKAADNVQAKSYKLFCRKYRPGVGIKTSLKNIGENPCEDTRTVNLPLYLFWNLDYYI